MMVVAIHIAGRMGMPILSINGDSILWWFLALGQWGMFSIAVPFFFVCSGFFLAKHIGENGWWRRECAKRVKSLLVPYVAWSSIFALLPFFAFLFANLLHGRVAVLELELNRRFLVQTFGLSPFRYPELVPLWYLRTLFLFVFVSPVLNHFTSKGGALFIALVYIGAIIVSVGMLSPGRVSKFLFYCFKLEGLVYFCLGMLFRKKEKEGKLVFTCDSRKHLLPWWALGTGLLLVLMITVVIHEKGLNIIALARARAVFIPPLLLAFWSFIPVRPFPKWLTDNTFALFLVHGVVLEAMWIVHPAQVETIPQWFVKWAFVFSASILSAMLLRRFAPGVSRILFGGR